MSSSQAVSEQPVRILKPWWALEDWVTVWVALISLIAIVVGFRPKFPSMKWAALGDLSKVFSADAGLTWLGIAGVVGLLSILGTLLTREKPLPQLSAFPVVFLLGLGAHLLAGNATANTWGLESVIFALVLGLLWNNTVGTPAWLLPAVRTEFYIKTGLILMGATILFGDILAAGALGILQSVLVVVVVWYFAFWLCRKFKLDDEFSTMLSTAVSICGVSAAIAACGAIEGDRKKLSYVTSIVLIVAVPMIVIQPWLVKTLGLSDIVGGAWIGGTLDTTGSVVAATELLGESATKVGTIVKFSQNVLLGLAAFLLSVWWSSRSANGKQGTSAAVIWQRFPKFVLGFVCASVIFSFAIDAATVKAVKPIVTNMRNIWFAMAFVSIGLETRFTDLLQMDEGRPLWAFLGAQAFNIVWTLLLSWLIFGGILFEVPKL
jgi:uncharacterized membrane protein YadS